MNRGFRHDQVKCNLQIDRCNMSCHVLAVFMVIPAPQVHRPSKTQQCQFCLDSEDGATASKLGWSSEDHESQTLSHENSQNMASNRDANKVSRCITDTKAWCLFFKLSDHWCNLFSVQVESSWSCKAHGFSCSSEICSAQKSGNLQPMQCTSESCCVAEAYCASTSGSWGLLFPSPGFAGTVCQFIVVYNGLHMFYNGYVFVQCTFIPFHSLTWTESLRFTKYQQHHPAYRFSRWVKSWMFVLCLFLSKAINWRKVWGMSEVGSWFV